MQTNRTSGARSTAVRGWRLNGLLAAGTGAVFMAAAVCGGRAAESSSAPAAASETPNESNVALAPPPLSEDTFPCSDCHDGEDVDRTRRPLDEHDNIVFDHDSKNRWCLDCHDAVDRDRLHLADGRLLEFSESHRLCGQCHGPKLRDWLAGDHGKRTGSWSGKKQYLLCVSCHDPHSPKFKPLAPKPPPVRPEDL